MTLDVARARVALGYTQAQFADALGVHVTTVSGWEAGRFEMRAPTRLYIETLLRDAGHDPSEFLATEQVQL